MNETPCINVYIQVTYNLYLYINIPRQRAVSTLLALASSCITMTDRIGRLRGPHATCRPQVADPCFTPIKPQARAFAVNGRSKCV